MKPFDRYLAQSRSRANSIEPGFEPEIVVVIPAYNEPLITHTLNSLKISCINTKILILVIINYPEQASQHTKLFNDEMFNVLQNWMNYHNTTNFEMKCLLASNLRRKHAGAGLARKIGMDTAAGIYNHMNRQNGIIISLDADCLVAENYFSAIYEHFSKKPDTNALLIDFQHRTSRIEPVHRRFMWQYEIYLHYFVMGCRLAGFPFAYHTIGSCFAINSATYVRQGGMNKKHAGEDFYFLHKIFPLGCCYRNYETCVYPSARVSKRVPFGTGPALDNLLKQNEPLKVYNPQAFIDLQAFYFTIQATEHYRQLMNKIPKSLKAFFAENNFEKCFCDARQNSASKYQFEKRVLQHFDAFQLVKYLNYAHENDYYKKIPVKNAATTLLALYGEAADTKLSNILKSIRKIEQKTTPRQPK